MSKAVEAQFDLLAPDYDQAVQNCRWTATAVVGAEIAAIDQVARDALVIGAGTGADLEAVSAKTSGRVVALDISARMLALAKAAYPSAESVVADFLQWDPEGQSFDLIVCVGALELIEDFESFFQRASGPLRVRGRLIVTHEPLIEGHPDYGRRVVEIGAPQYRRPTQALLKAAARNGLKLRGLKHFVAWVRKGQPVIYELLNLQKVG